MSLRIGAHGVESMRAGASPPLEYLWRFEVAVPPAALWQYISDTSKLNRALGLAPMRFHEQDGALHGTGTNGGLEQRWVEHAWSWVAGRIMVAERHFSSGWAQRVRVAYELERSESGTTLSAYFAWWPRGWFSGGMLRLGMVMMRSRLRRVLAGLSGDQPGTWPQPSQQPLSAAGEARLQRVSAALKRDGCDERLVARLAEHIRHGHDDEVYRLRVRQLARIWQADEQALLQTCLYATRHGLLALSWDVVCPHCRGPRVETDALADVPSVANCEVCQVEFGTDSENAIEVTFHLHPAVRRVERKLFCSAQAATQRHVLVQQRLEAGTSRKVAVALEPGRYRMRQLGRPEMAFLDIDEDAEAAADGAAETGAAEAGGDTPPLTWNALTGPTSQRCAALGHAHFRNNDAQSTTFVIETLGWPDDVLTPAQLFGSARFRDLFSEQLLAPDVRLFVGEQVVLFTDLVGSSRMYVARGDAEAFATVRSHFKLVEKVILGRGGALVKTMGDAAMAVFDNPQAALEAAFGVLECFAGEGADLGLELRISVNSGVCLAVNLNHNIDYFGHVVNVAAKLQALAGPGEVVIGEALFEKPEVAAWLQTRGYHGEATSLRLSGLAQPLGALLVRSLPDATTTTLS